MMNFPLDSGALFGNLVGNFVFVLAGALFGVTLELAGFGDSKKLAAQFYFHDMRVLKTMFTGIIVACVLIFLSYFLGYLDFSKIFVNPTYLWPGIVGGLIMGVGFITGGYCPGTSIVSMSSLKIDGFVFFIGAVIGTGLFGETVEYFQNFWISFYSERYLLSDLFGWKIETVVLAIVVMALGIFYIVEVVEAKINKTKLSQKMKRAYLVSSAALMVVTIFLFALGEPSFEKKWSLMSSDLQAGITQRDIFIHPLEYVKTWNDPAVKLVTLDLRENVDFNQFHLEFSKNIEVKELLDINFLAELKKLPPNTVVILVAQNEDLAIDSWKRLKVLGLANVYILDKGIPFWKEFFMTAEARYTVKFPLKSGHGPSDISKPHSILLELYSEVEVVPKIKLKTSKKSGGVCG